MECSRTKCGEHAGRNGPDRWTHDRRRKDRRVHSGNSKWRHQLLHKYTRRSEKWEDMIVSEFVPMIESSTRGRIKSRSRNQRYIDGRLREPQAGVKHPDMFGSVSAHSAVLLADLSAARVSDRRLQLFQSLFDRIYASTRTGLLGRNNPMTLAKDTKKLNGLKIYFDCGTETTTVSMPAPSCSTKCSQKHPIPTKHTSIPAPRLGLRRKAHRRINAVPLEAFSSK